MTFKRAGHFSERISSHLGEEASSNLCLRETVYQERCALFDMWWNVLQRILSSALWEATSKLGHVAGCYNPQTFSKNIPRYELLTCHKHRFLLIRRGVTFSSRAALINTHANSPELWYIWPVHELGFFRWKSLPGFLQRPGAISLSIRCFPWFEYSPDYPAKSAAFLNSIEVATRILWSVCLALIPIFLSLQGWHTINLVYTRSADAGLLCQLQRNKRWWAAPISTHMPKHIDKHMFVFPASKRERSASAVSAAGHNQNVTNRLHTGCNKRFGM